MLSIDSRKLVAEEPGGDLRLLFALVAPRVSTEVLSFPSFIDGLRSPLLKCFLLDFLDDDAVVMSNALLSYFDDVGGEEGGPDFSIEAPAAGKDDDLGRKVLSFELEDNAMVCNSLLHASENS